MAMILELEEGSSEHSKRKAKPRMVSDSVKNDIHLEEKTQPRTVRFSSKSGVVPDEETKPSL